MSDRPATYRRGERAGAGAELLNRLIRVRHAAGCGGCLGRPRRLAVAFDLSVFAYINGRRLWLSSHRRRRCWRSSRLRLPAPRGRRRAPRSPRGLARRRPSHAGARPCGDPWARRRRSTRAARGQLRTHRRLPDEQSTGLRRARPARTRRSPHPQVPPFAWPRTRGQRRARLGREPTRGPLHRGQHRSRRCGQTALNHTRCRPANRRAHRRPA